MTRDGLIARLRYYDCEDAGQGDVLADAIAMLQRDAETIEKLRAFARDVATNWDCDKESDDATP